jgi:hypothetical protein
MAHLVTTTEPCTGQSTGRQSPNSPRMQKMGHLPTFPRAETRSVTTATTRCNPSSSLGGPIRSVKALEGITHPSKASRATPGGCARAHPPDSLLQITQTSINPNGMTRVHACPSVLLKNTRDNDVTAERPSDQSLATRGGLGGFSRILT